MHGGRAKCRSASPRPSLKSDRVFFTSFYDGSLLLRLAQDKPDVEKLWQIAGRDEKNTEALHSIIATPVFENGYIYGVDSYGELRCLDAADGHRVWEDKTAVPRPAGARSTSSRTAIATFCSMSAVN